MEQSPANTPDETKKLSGPFWRAAKVLYFVITLPIVVGSSYIFISDHAWLVSVWIVFGFIIFTDVLLRCINYVGGENFKWFITIELPVIAFMLFLGWVILTFLRILIWMIL